MPWQHCGTWVGAYIRKGTRPIILGEVEDAEVCFSAASYSFENCNRKQPIKIRNCGSYLLYELQDFQKGTYGAYCAV